MDRQSLLELVQHQGYYLFPPSHPDSLGSTGLVVVIRKQPTGKHFDPRTLHLTLRDDKDIARQRTLSWLSPPADSNHVCPGRLILSDRFDKRVEFFTFGGSLEVISEPDKMVHSLHSPAPILELTAQQETLPDQLAFETEALMSKTKATRGLDDRGFNRRLAEVDPFQFYVSALQSILLQYECARTLEELYHESHDALLREKERLVAEALWPTNPPGLEDLLAPDLFERTPSQQPSPALPVIHSRSKVRVVKAKDHRSPGGWKRFSDKHTGGDSMPFLQREIQEQPQVLTKLLEQELDNGRRIAADLRARDIRYVVIAARGTSDNAARYGQYLLGAHNRLPVGLATPSLFSVYGEPPRLEGSLVVGISQSGQSPDIVSVLREGRRQGVPTLAISNDPNSPLAMQADYIIPLHAGEERAVAATKTYTAQLAVLALLSCTLGDDPDRLEALRRVPLAVERVLGDEAWIAETVERYRYMETCVVLGRGYNYATAFEIALKLKELNYLIAESYSSADFMHGPIAVVRSGFPAIVVAPSGKMLGTMRSFSLELKSRGAELLIISDRQDLLAEAITPLQLPESVPEWLSPIVAVIPGQLFALHLTVVKGHDPDRPRGLRKVTSTR